MTHNELPCIATVSSTGHFGRTAEQCLLSQPVLSVTIKEPEEELGVILFQRSRNQLWPAPTGQHTLDGAVGELDENVAAISNITQQTREPRRETLNPAIHACKVQTL